MQGDDGDDGLQGMLVSCEDCS